MSDLITDDVVETATRANYDVMTRPGAWAELDSDLQDRTGERAAMRDALEAVAPLIAAKALRSLAADMEGDGWNHVDDWGVPAIYPNAVFARADRIERGDS